MYYFYARFQIIYRAKPHGPWYLTRYKNIYIEGGRRGDGDGRGGGSESWLEERTFGDILKKKIRIYVKKLYLSKILFYANFSRITSENKENEFENQKGAKLFVFFGGGGKGRV